MDMIPGVGWGVVGGGSRGNLHKVHLLTDRQIDRPKDR